MVRDGGSVGDLTGDELALGAADGGLLVDRQTGEILLAPTIAARFDERVLPPGWSIDNYVDAGNVHLDRVGLELSGARVGTDALYLGNRSLEFEATFAPRPDQHVGFGLDFVNVPWVAFSTKWGRRLYARTHFVVSEDKRLDGDWLGAPHRFRIAWRVLDVLFAIDGSQVAKLLVPMPPLMRPLAANLRSEGSPLKVAWMRMSPYQPAGRFTSRPLDAGRTVSWATGTWQHDTPEGTTLAIAVRGGDSATPDLTWSPWTNLSHEGAPIDAATRYLQYRAELATSDPSQTPVLRSFQAAYRVPDPDLTDGDT